MSLSFENRTLGVQIDGEAASIGGGFGVYPLTLRLRLTPMGFEPRTVVEVAADIGLQGVPECWLAASTRPVRVALYGSPVSVALVFPLTSAQILGIEERRSGGKAAFTLKVHAIIVGDPADAGRESGETFVIASSTWLDLTEQVGAAVAFTIPIPVAITPGAHAEGAELLKEARRHLNAGSIDAAIVSARKAMDRAEAAALWPGVARNDDLRSRSQAQRWRAIHKAAFDQASGAAHEDEVTKEFTYTRREAEALIGIAAALLKAAPGPLA